MTHGEQAQLLCPWYLFVNDVVLLRNNSIDVCLFDFFLQKTILNKYDSIWFDLFLVDKSLEK